MCSPVRVCLCISSPSHQSCLLFAYVLRRFYFAWKLFCLKYEVWKILSSLLLVVAVDGRYFQIPLYHI